MDRSLILSPVKVKGLMSVDKQGYLLHYQVENDDDIAIYSFFDTCKRFLLIFSVDEQFMTPEQFQRRDENDRRRRSF